MPDEESVNEVFSRLAAIFAPYRPPLIAKTDTPGDLYLETLPSATYPEGVYFGAVKIGKRYVSFQLMPVYVHPELLDDISPELRKRMQGKSCFNFTAPDDALFAELRTLTEAGFASFRRDGTIPAAGAG
jgi:hypothetical protein